MGIRLGQLENARRHIFVSKTMEHDDEGTTMHMQKLLEIGKHIGACSEARRLGDWKRAMKEADAAAHAGADSSPQVINHHIYGQPSFLLILHHCTMHGLVQRMHVN